jgi:hypothetical protein
MERHLLLSLVPNWRRTARLTESVVDPPHLLAFGGAIGSWRDISLVGRARPTPMMGGIDAGNLPRDRMSDGSGGARKIRLSPLWG